MLLGVPAWHLHRRPGARKLRTGSDEVQSGTGDLLADVRARYSLPPYTLVAPPGAGLRILRFQRESYASDNCWHQSVGRHPGTAELHPGGQHLPMLVPRSNLSRYFLLLTSRYGSTDLRPPVVSLPLDRCTPILLPHRRSCLESPAG